MEELLKLVGMEIGKDIMGNPDGHADGVELPKLAPPPAPMMPPQTQPLGLMGQLGQVAQNPTGALTQMSGLDKYKNLWDSLNSGQNFFQPQMGANGQMSPSTFGQLMNLNSPSSNMGFSSYFQ